MCKQVGASSIKKIKLKNFEINMKLKIKQSNTTTYWNCRANWKNKLIYKIWIFVVASRVAR